VIARASGEPSPTASGRARAPRADLRRAARGGIRRSACRTALRERLPAADRRDPLGPDHRHRVNKATPALFERYPTPADLAGADQLEVEGYVKTLGFYHQKAKNIIATARCIVAEFGGEVPDTMEGLTSLSGVARKTANIVLARRLARSRASRSTLTCSGWHTASVCRRTTTQQGRARPDVALPQDHWHRVNYDLITHGRQVCTAKRPACGACFLSDECPSAFKPAGWRQEI